MEHSGVEMKPRQKRLKFDITAQRLRDVLDYDPNAGIFTWRVDGKAHKAGDHAGTFDRKQ